VSYLRDRFVHVQARQRSGSSFAQALPTIGLRNGLAPRQRFHQGLVLCLDPGRPGHPAPTEQTVGNQINGSDGGLSLRGWLSTNTGARVSMGQAQLVNCGPFAPAPPEHAGWWYWQGGPGENRHAEAWRDAIRAADGQVDFHAYDSNADGRVTRDELALFIVRPQDVPYGTNRGIDVAVDGNPTPLRFELEDLFLSANGAYRRQAVGLMAHETGHLLLDGDDMYIGDSCPSYPQLAGIFNIMDTTYGATHLGPLEKLKGALVTPDALPIEDLVTQTVPLASVEGRREVTILYDPARQDREYFLLENRWGAGDLYDQGLFPQNSVAVWLLIEDPALAQQHPPPGGAACHWKPKSTRRLANLQTVGASADLRWADGSSAGVRITLKGAVGDMTSVEIARLP